MPRILGSIKNYPLLAAGVVVAVVMLIMAGCASTGMYDGQKRTAPEIAALRAKQQREAQAKIDQIASKADDALVALAQEYEAKQKAIVGGAEQDMQAVLDSEEDRDVAVGLAMKEIEKKDNLKSLGINALLELPQVAAQAAANPGSLVPWLIGIAITAAGGGATAEAVRKNKVAKDSKTEAETAKDTQALIVDSVTEALRAVDVRSQEAGEAAREALRDSQQANNVEAAVAEAKARLKSGVVGKVGAGSGKAAA